MVVDLAVERDPHSVVFIGHGLVASLEIDDLESTCAEAYLSADVDSSVVWSTMDDRSQHSINSGRIDLTVGLAVEDANNATHALRKEIKWLPITDIRFPDTRLLFVLILWEGLPWLHTPDLGLLF